MELPFFSIIIPSYNRAHVIERAVLSIVNQTFSNWECIVVDDGSSDNTKNVIGSIQDERVQYIYQENAERCVARNNGAKRAKGKYLLFLDSDDYFMKNHLKILYKRISQDNCPAAMYFTYAYHIINGSLIKPKSVFGLEINQEYLLSNPIIPTRTCIHASVFIDFEFEADIVIGEDLILWLRILSKYPVFEVPFFTVNYCLHEENSVNIKNNSFLQRLNGLRLFKKRYRDIYLTINSKLWKRLVSDTYFGIARYYIFCEKDFYGSLYLLKSLLKDLKNRQFVHRLNLIIYLVLLKYFGAKHNIIKEYRR